MPAGVNEASQASRCALKMAIVARASSTCRNASRALPDRSRATHGRMFCALNVEVEDKLGQVAQGGPLRLAQLLQRFVQRGVSRLRFRMRKQQDLLALSGFGASLSATNLEIVPDGMADQYPALAQIRNLLRDFLKRRGAPQIRGSDTTDPGPVVRNLLLLSNKGIEQDVAVASGGVKR
jgi:hypothetical protein